MDIYGEEIVVNGKELEQNFLPYVGNKVFPNFLKEHGFHRHTKPFTEEFNLLLSSSSTIITSSET